MAFGPFFPGEALNYQITIKDPETGVVVDLTGYTGVNFYFRKDRAVANKFSSTVDAGVIADPPTDGIVSFDMNAAGAGWVDADVGGWTLQLELIHATHPRKTEKIRFQIEPALAETT